MPISTDTPRKSKHIPQSELASDLKDSRSAVIDDVGVNIPQIHVDRFFSNVLPQLPSRITPDDLNVISSEVKAAQYTSNGRWAAFPKDPDDACQNEDQVFKGLIKIARAVETATADRVQGLRPTATLSNAPDSVPKSLWKTNLTRPDGYFILREKQHPERPHWMDIAFPAEYKRADTFRSINDDIEKTIWNMHHIMREDPRRRFTYAFTVENRTMRLWYASRSEILVSDPFDFIAQPDLLIRFLVVISFASERDLGWDPTMVKVGGTYQYDIEVLDTVSGELRRYRTHRLISDVSACSIRGRGTRVWEAYLLDDTGNPTGDLCIIKDSWPDSDREREGNVLAAIRAEATPEDRKFFKETLLTVLAHGDVVLDGQTKDQTLGDEARAFLETRPSDPENRKFSIKQVDLSERAILRRERAESRKQSQLAGSHVDSAHVTRARAESKPDVTYSSKSHYRIVFKEVCKPLYEEQDLGNIFFALEETCEILSRIHRTRWVHRDISAGNVLLYPSEQPGVFVTKLSDFEYAKRLGVQYGSPHDILTGTDDFMSVEVRRGMYLFEPSRNRRHAKSPLPEENAEPPRPRTWRARAAATLAEKAVTPAPVPVTSPTAGDPWGYTWSYNPLHDMESVWWLAAYFLFAKDFKIVLDGRETREEQDTNRIEKQESFAATLFLTATRDERLTAFAMDNFLARKLVLLPPCLVVAGEYLDQIRQDLMATYREAEKNVDLITHDVAASVNPDMQDNLEKMARHVHSKTLAVEVKQSIFRTWREIIATREQERSSVKRAPDDASDELGDDSGEDYLPSLSTAPGKRRKTGTST